MSTDDSKIVHLYNLAHYRCLNPILTAHSVGFETVTANAGVNAPKGRSHCEACGMYQLPGITSSTRIKYSKPKAKGGKRIRSLSTKCLVCSYVERATGLINMKPAPTPQTSAGDSVPKKRKKKKNTLSSLLERKKQQESEPLGLFDFM